MHIAPLHASTGQCFFNIMKTLSIIVCNQGTYPKSLCLLTSLNAHATSESVDSLCIEIALLLISLNHSEQTSPHSQHKYFLWNRFFFHRSFPEQVIILLLWFPCDNPPYMCYYCHYLWFSAYIVHLIFGATMSISFILVYTITQTL